MGRYRYVGITIGAWSLSPLLARVGLDHGFSPMVSTSMGTLVAAPILLLLIVRARKSRPRTMVRPSGTSLIVIGGMLGVGGTLLNYLALSLTSVPAAISISNTHPLFTTGLAVMVVRTERLTRRTFAGSALIVVGITSVALASR